MPKTPSSLYGLEQYPDYREPGERSDPAEEAFLDGATPLLDFVANIKGGIKRALGIKEEPLVPGQKMD